MKKVYFIKRSVSGTTHSGQWRHTLKQTYKSSNAIKDIIDWAADGKEFYVAITDRQTSRKRLVYHINPPGSSAMITDFATKRPVVGVIDMILQWTQKGRDFDITLLERKRAAAFGNEEAPTLSGRLRYLGKSQN